MVSTVQVCPVRTRAAQAPQAGLDHRYALPHLLNFYVKRKSYCQAVLVCQPHYTPAPAKQNQGLSRQNSRESVHQGRQSTALPRLRGDVLPENGQFSFRSDQFAILFHRISPSEALLPAPADIQPLPLFPVEYFPAENHLPHGELPTTQPY